MARALAGFIVVVFGLIVWLAWADYKQQQAEAHRWAVWSSLHNCKVVGREKGVTTTGVGTMIGTSSNGGTTIIPVVTTSRTPDKTAYLCDDGITYWRNDQ